MYRHVPVNWSTVVQFVCGMSHGKLHAPGSQQARGYPNRQEGGYARRYTVPSLVTIVYT